MNNNKKTITICSIIALIILAIVVIVTLISELTSFAIIFGAFFIVLIVCLAIYLREEPDEFNAFVKNKKRILRTYDSVIVEVEDIPNIAGKNIIKVKSIEDLVDAQLELREPIYYKNDNDSCFFLLLHYNEACIFVLRMNDSVVSPTEQSIRYMKEENVDKAKEQENILENLEKTVVYKLDELRSFRISPIRNNEKINVVDDTAIKKEIESSKEQEITSNALSSELSKTMYLKDLRERMLKYEEEQNAKTSEIKAIKEEIKNATSANLVEENKDEKQEEITETPEISPLERLRKMVKEQEQELTKELKINTTKEEKEPKKENEIDTSDSKEQKHEEKEVELEIVDNTETIENIPLKEENEEESALDNEEKIEEIVTTKKIDNDVISYVNDDEQEDEIINGIVVLHSLEDEEDTISGPITIGDIEDEEKITIVEETSTITKIDDLKDITEMDEIEILKNNEIPVIEEKTEEVEKDEEPAEEIIDEPKLGLVEETEDSEENEENEDSEEIEDTIASDDEAKEEIEIKKKEVSKTRRNTKSKKVTHSTRRAQKHVSNRTKR